MIFCKFFNGDCCSLNDLASGQIGINICRFNGGDSADNDCDSFIETEGEDTDDEVYWDCELERDEIYNPDEDYDEDD